MDCQPDADCNVRILLLHDSSCVMKAYVSALAFGREQANLRERRRGHSVKSNKGVVSLTPSPLPPLTLKSQSDFSCCTDCKVWFDILALDQIKTLNSQSEKSWHLSRLLGESHVIFSDNCPEAETDESRGFLEEWSSSQEDQVSILCITTMEKMGREKPY